MNMGQRLLPALLTLLCLGYGAVISPEGYYWQRAPVLPVIFAVIFLIQLAGFLHAWWRHTERFYDLLGSLSFILAVCFALLLNPAPSTFNYLLAGLVVVWAARLGSFLFLRIADVGEDRRFRRIKQSFWRFMLIWTLQGVWVSLTSSAALVAILTDMPGAVPALAWVGIGVWLLGFATEAVADAQKSAFRKDSSRQGQFIHHGLWSVCRHPNYLGEIILWFGVWLAALPALAGWQHAALLSPVFVVLLLTRISGIPTLASRGLSRWGDDPAYQAYLRQTRPLMPRVPRPLPVDNA